MTIRFQERLRLMRLKSVIRVSMYIRELMTLTQCTADAGKDVGMKKLKLEEAITILQDMKVDIPVPKAAVMQTKRNVALDMAIDALKCSEMPNSSQCISRQAAIDAVEILLEQTEEDADVKTWNNAIRGAINSIKHHVSSAQPEPIRINLNEPIKVKLTDWGKEIYYHQYDRTNQIAGREICKPRFPREDENGYTEFQLWCFIELYGMHMGMTLPNVIEPLEIVYER